MGKLSIKQVEVLEGKRQHKKLYNRVTYNRKNTTVSSYTSDECGFNLDKNLTHKSDTYIIQAIKNLYESLDIPFDVTYLSPTRNEKARKMVEGLYMYCFHTVEKKLNSFLKDISKDYPTLFFVYDDYFREHNLLDWYSEHKDYRSGDIPLIKLLRELNPELAERLFEHISAELHVFAFIGDLDDIQEDYFYTSVEAFPVAVLLYDEAYLKKLSQYSSDPDETLKNLKQLQKP